MAALHFSASSADRRRAHRNLGPHEKKLLDLPALNESANVHQVTRRFPPQLVAFGAWARPGAVHAGALSLHRPTETGSNCRSSNSETSIADAGVSAMPIPGVPRTSRAGSALTDIYLYT